MTREFAPSLRTPRRIAWMSARPRTVAKMRLRPLVVPLEDRVAPAVNLFISTQVAGQSVIQEYQPNGTLVRTINVPQPGDAPLRGIALDLAGRILGYNGTSDPYLSTYNQTTQAWSHRTATGWSSAADASLGAVAIHQDPDFSATDYVFATDDNTVGNEPADSLSGIVRFDLNSAAAVRFATGQQFADVTMGLNGKLYALRALGAGGVGGVEVVRFDPVTLAQEAQVTLPSIFNGVTFSLYRGLAVDQAGNLYLTCEDGNIYKYSGAGLLITALAGFPSTGLDIAIAPDGRIVATFANQGFVTTTTTLLTSQQVVIPGAANFCAWAVDVAVNTQPPVALDNEAATERNGVMQIDPRGNDFDPDGNPLRYVSFTQPGHGTVEAVPGGALRYFPFTNFVGTDSFTYVVTDGQSNAAASVVIDVRPLLGQVSAAIAGGRVQILGSNADDAIRIELGFAGPHTVRVTGLNGTLVNDSVTEPAEFTNVRKGILVQLQDGLDRVEVVGTGVKGMIDLDGGANDDRYVISSTNAKMRITDVNGVDWLDFSAAAFGVTVNLGAGKKKQQAIGGGNALILASTIENVLGSGSNDRITGNAANNVLLGGDGNDELIANAGRNLLIGGGGSDRLRGSQQGNVLIAGTTAFDDDATALNMILDEWGSGRPWPTRVSNLINGSGSTIRVNASFFLVPGATVFADGVPNDLQGDDNPDFLFP